MAHSLNKLFLNNNIYVISGFAGIGKSTLAKLHPEAFIDLDSSQFSWKDYNPNADKEASKGTFKERNENFPQDYVRAIKKCISEHPDKVILISQHQPVRDELVKNNINFVLAFPAMEEKEEFIKRYQSRGNNDKFIELLSQNWTAWIGALQQETQSNGHINLTGYLSEFIESIAYPCPTRVSEQRNGVQITNTKNIQR
ncbi:MAG: hypothetical protein IKL32_00940 [Alphaproteobacteria bacterium]|nr:hypothetical protein [Alphaproteobacteria bacterium]